MSVLELQRSEGLELRLVEVHRKTKQKSIVPLPCPRPTHELIAAIQGKSAAGLQQQQQQQQQRQAGGQAAPRAPAPGHNVSAHPPPPAGGAAAGSAHPDRKRARSPGVKAEGTARRDVVDLSRSSNDSRRYRSPRAQQPAYEPLDRPPSPFLNADQKMTSAGWLPDLRPNQPRERASPLKQQQQQSQQHRQAQRDGRDKDRERDQGRHRDREQRAGGPSPGRPPRSQDRGDANRSASKSPHIRPSSHERPRGSQRRSNSRDRQVQSSDAVSSVAASAVQPLSSPLEEGEVRLEPQALSTIREEGSSEPPKSTGQLDLPLSTRMLAASGPLTKSCSTLTLSSLSVSSSSLMHSRLHASASMSDLSSVVPAAGGVDILAGDILRMSSSHSPSDSALSLSLGAAVVNEDDIMREINRGKSELQCDHDEQIDEEEEQRHAKRARIGSSHPASPDASHRDFESSTHSATESSATAAAPTDMDSSTATSVPVAAEASSAETIVPPVPVPATSPADGASVTAAPAAAAAAAAVPAPAVSDAVSAPMDVDVPVASSAPVDVATELHFDEKKACEGTGAGEVHAAAVRADASPLKQAADAAAAADAAVVPDAASLKQSPSDPLHHAVANGHALLPDEHKTAAMETTLN